MTKQEFDRRLKAFRDEFEREVLPLYRRENWVLGNEAYQRWRSRFIEFLKEYDQREAARFELLTSTDDRRDLHQKQTAYNSFMSAAGNTCLAVLAGLEESATPKTPPQVFLSYAREDAEHARRLFLALREAGLNPWFDKESLLPGQNWRSAVRDAIRESRFFIALLSSNSVSKKGYVQKELKDALAVLEEYPASSVFIIPVRLDDCEPSYAGIRELHWVDLFEGWDKGLASIIRTTDLHRSV